MALVTNKASSSSSYKPLWKYDVFLNFRGEDTRYGFVSHLYQALCDKGFNTFIDSNLQKGEEISTELLKAIEMSMISIIVFSENYAFSTWCLNELVKILECRNYGQLVIPIFYKVNPSEIRKQEGKFKLALANHEEKFKDNLEKVQRWRKALTKATDLSGLIYKDREIVQQESEELENRSRIWYYKDAHEVLTRNMGLNKIRGIMWCSPKPITVSLEAKAFKRMENLKFLIVRNVHICEELRYLPNGLRLLEWHEFPFSLPSKYCPQQLVALDMPHSRIGLEKLLKQGIRFENLKLINLSWCESIVDLPKLLAPNLEELDLSCCKNLVRLETLFEQGSQFKNLKGINFQYCESITKLPNLRAPNLEKLDLRYCRNLVEIHESIGFLDKLERWYLIYCEKLKTLPSNLMLKSLDVFDLEGCLSLEKFPDIHPEMKCLESLDLQRSGIRELPSSIEYLTSLTELHLNNCQNLRDLPDSIYKLQMLKKLWISTTKLRPVCNSFDSFSGYGVLRLEHLNLSDCENIIDLDFFMKPDYFPFLKYLDLSGTNVVTIPKSISRFTKLKELQIYNCNQLREIPMLPQSIRRVYAKNSLLLDPQSSCRLLIQFGEILRLLPDRICDSAISDILIDPQPSSGLLHELVLPSLLFDDFSSKTEDYGSEDEDDDCEITVPGTEIPQWFNYQSVGNSISFQQVGRKFPKFAVCIAFGPEAHIGECYCEVYLSINGCKKFSMIQFL